MMIQHQSITKQLTTQLETQDISIHSQMSTKIIGRKSFEFEENRDIFHQNTLKQPLPILIWVY